MAGQRTRLDRFISARLTINRRDVKLMLAQNRIRVDGELATCVQQAIDAFSLVQVDGQVLQDNQARYLMLHKPIGVVSATKDDQHRTILDLLPEDQRAGLHMVGRLDRYTSGLMLLTNDGRWSRYLTAPESKVSKTYHVTLQNPLNKDYISAFQQGMHFAYEGIITRPAQLQILSEFEALVTLQEGKYHQIKRMFGRFRNPVVKLHRQSIGNLALDPALAPGESRALSQQELKHISIAHPRCEITSEQPSRPIQPTR